MDGSPDGSEPRQLREVAVRVAEEAARVAARLRAQAITQVRTKSSDTDPVTSADTATEELLRARLAQLRPADAVLGEEGGLSSDERESRPGQLCWMIDPIDGTVNYVYGFPWYSVSVAVTRDGVPLAGAVVEPDSGRVWSAAEATGRAGRRAAHPGAGHPAGRLGVVGSVRGRRRVAGRLLRARHQPVGLGGRRPGRHGGRRHRVPAGPLGPVRRRHRRRRPGHPGPTRRRADRAGRRRDLAAGIERRGSNGADLTARI